jgi:hypothetical protein
MARSFEYCNEILIDKILGISYVVGKLLVSEEVL